MCRGDDAIKGGSGLTVRAQLLSDTHLGVHGQWLKGQPKPPILLDDFSLSGCFASLLV